MPKKQLKAADLKGLFIHQDKKHGTVYYDIFTGNGYVFTTSETKYYSLSLAFLPIAVVIFYFATQFNLNTGVSLIVAAISYLIMQIVYRIAFLYKLPCVKHYKVDRQNNVITNLANNYSSQRLVALVVMALALVGVMIAYVLLNDFTGFTLVGMCILVAIAIALLIISLIALLKKKNQ